MALASVVSKTLGKLGTLPSVPRKTLSKPKNYFFKKNVFAECLAVDTGQTVIFRQVGRDGYFCLPSVKRALGKGFAECPKKDTRQSLLCHYFLLSPFCRVWHSANCLPSVFLPFAECPGH